MKSISITRNKILFWFANWIFGDCRFLFSTDYSFGFFEGEYNILKSGFADLSPFFAFAPWILIFLIPAVTMRSFSDEKKQGTIEFLFTKPLSVLEIVNGKFLGAFLLIVIAIIPTLIYVYVISSLRFARRKYRLWVVHWVLISDCYF